MVFKFVYLIYYLSFVTLIHEVSSERRIYPRLTVFKMCDNRPYPIYIQNLHFSMDNNRVQLINFEGNVTKDISDVSLKSTVYRCKDRESLDTCSYFTKFQTAKVCEALMSNSLGIQSFLKCVTPRILCPIKKTLHVAKDCKLSYRGFSAFPLTGSYWKIQSELLSRNEKLFCLYTEGFAYEVKS